MAPTVGPTTPYVQTIHVVASGLLERLNAAERERDAARAEVERLTRENQAMRDDPDSAFDALDIQTARLLALEAALGCSWGLGALDVAKSVMAEVERLTRERDEALSKVGIATRLLRAEQGTCKRAHDRLDEAHTENKRLRRVVEAARGLLQWVSGEGRREREAAIDALDEALDAAEVKR